MKALFTFFLIVTVFSVSAQDRVIVKYFDSAWKPTSKENASFYTHFVKEDTLYKCTSYYAKSNKLYGKSIYSDTLFKTNLGLKVSYFGNGRLRDSSFRDLQGKIVFFYSYYENGKPHSLIYNEENGNYRYIRSYYENGRLKDSTIADIHSKRYNDFRYYENGELLEYSYFDTLLNNYVYKGYDENGRIISSYIHQKEAEFPEGTEGWKRFLERNLNSNIPASNGAPVGLYRVIINFTVDKEGNLSNISAENDPGYGTKEEALRVFDKSPNWEPAIQYNKPVSYRAKQQIAFRVTKE